MAATWSGTDAAGSSSTAAHERRWECDRSRPRCAEIDATEVLLVTSGWHARRRASSFGPPFSARARACASQRRLRLRLRLEAYASWQPGPSCRCSRSSRRGPARFRPCVGSGSQRPRPRARGRSCRLRRRRRERERSHGGLGGRVLQRRRPIGRTAADDHVAVLGHVEPVGGRAPVGRHRRAVDDADARRRAP